MDFKNVPPIIYRLNADDKITFVDDNWTGFAISNGSATLTAERVVGSPIWDYVSDVTTRHLYRIFMHRVRELGRSVTVPFRCDAPDVRRFMQVTIRPLPDAALEFYSELLSEELRSHIDLMEPDFPRSTGFVHMCSWCKKVKAPDWVEVEEGVQRLQLFNQSSLPWISHTICPNCEQWLDNFMKTG